MPKCNFVIRYNFVSNEIGSVQSKGRARAPNSECYLIVDRGSVNERREYENLEKEHMMMQALNDISELEPTELHASIATERVRHHVIVALYFGYHFIFINGFIKRHKGVTSEVPFPPRHGRNRLWYSLHLPTEGRPG